MYRESITCPTCGTTFRSPASLATHLNDPSRLSQCSLTGSNNIPIPIPPAFYARHGEEVTGCYYESSGYIYGRGQTLLEKLKADEHERRREHVMHYPFADEGKWELGKFLTRHLNKSAIDEFLKLKWVRAVVADG